MTRTLLRRPAILGLCLLSLIACGGGGGGGSDSSDGGDNPDGELNPAVDFFVVGAALARPIFAPGGATLSGSQPLVNPASLQEVDPNTGVSLPGFPKVLNPGTELGNLSSINLAQVNDPITPQIPLVPRNAAIVLEFSKTVDRATLRLDDSDPDAPGVITANSPVQVRNKAGALQPARAFVIGKRVAIVGITPSTLGFPASPLLFGPMGEPVEDPTGHLRLVLGVGAGPLLADDGTVFQKRPDLNGLLPFNPGNAGLDAVVLQTEAGAVGFNGFLPDLTAPRIVRPVTLDGTISAIDAVATPDGTAFRISDATLAVLPNEIANDGLGEWAGASITITSAGGVTNSLEVAMNFNDLGTAVYQLVAGEGFPPVVQAGDSYTLERTEFYEPIPGPLPSDPQELAEVTVDVDQAPRDPNDPQDQFNSDLRYFLRVFDESGVERLDRWNPATGTFLPIPPKSSLQLQFSEPMDVLSFRPYESFYVTDASLMRTEPGFREMRLGDVDTSVAGDIVRFRPVLIDQQEGTEEFVGFGGTAQNLALVIRTIPSPTTLVQLADSVSAGAFDQFKDIDFLGVRGITDLGGRGLGLPDALLDEGNTDNFLLAESSPGLGPFAPAIDFRVELETEATTDPNYRAVVHRFMGQAVTAIFNPPAGQPSDPVTEGVEYADFPPVDEDGDGDIDRKFIYGPRVLDVGLNAPGNLVGGSAATIEHLIDNFNPPAPGSFTNPLGEDFLLSVGFGVSMPLDSPFGARFQHVFRATDASPSKNDFFGVNLDLTGLAWSPFNNAVTNSTLDGLGIVVGLSNAGFGLGPNTNQTGGIPAQPESGLARQFDCNWLEYNEHCFGCAGSNVINPSLVGAVAEQPPYAFVVNRKTPYTMLQTNLFNPLSASGGGGNFNRYLNYPTFNNGIDPFFDNPNVKSYPYDSRFPMLVELRVEPNAIAPPRTNFYRFSPGILTSVLPRFRAWSQGQDPLAACLPNMAQSLANLGGLPINGANPVTGSFGGEGGPLLEPGTFTASIAPPPMNNGMKVIPANDYILPPRALGTCEALQPNDPISPVQLFNAPDPSMDPNEGCIVVLPNCRANPNINYYRANGLLAYPLPNLTAFPGPAGMPATRFRGYGWGQPIPGVGGSVGSALPNGLDESSCLIPVALSGPPGVSNEPGMTAAPQVYGDNTRYYMLWKYRKRVSLVESPTVEIECAPGESVLYSRPIVEPPLSAVDPSANLRVELRAGPSIELTNPGVDSGYVNITADDFTAKIEGDGLEARNFVKFRASFGVAPQAIFSPQIDTVVIPYRKVSP